jgi:hypothetical protein
MNIPKIYATVLYFLTTERDSFLYQKSQKEMVNEDRISRTNITETNSKF